MIIQRAPDEITSWSLAFFERGRFRGERFLPGRFKHVIAFGYSDPCKTWLVLDVTFGATRLYVLPDGPWGKTALAEWIKDAAILSVPPQKRDRGGMLGTHPPSPQGGGGGAFLRPFTCVSAAAHLVGVPSAVLPDGLWRSCLRNGAVIVQDGKLARFDLRPARRA